MRGLPGVAISHGVIAEHGRWVGGGESSGGGKEEADVATVARSFQIWAGVGRPAVRVGYFDLSFLSKKCLHGSVGYSA